MLILICLAWGVGMVWLIVREQHKKDREIKEAQRRQYER